MASRWIAEQSVKLSKLPSFRAEHFPYSGPYPWLDQVDALEAVEAKLAAGEITVEQAALADEVCSILMGDDVPQRRHFIQTNAKDVRFLDI